MEKKEKRTYKNNEVIFNNRQISANDFENIIKQSDNVFHWLLYCSFANANINIHNNKLHFMDGVWLDGTFENSTWINGIWKNGWFSNSLWNNGLWENGNFHLSTWISGTWGAGYFKQSLWVSGVWFYGIFENSTWQNGTWSDGFFECGNVWNNGFWRNGIFQQSTWHGGIWEYGTIIDSNILGGMFEKIDWRISLSNKTTCAGIFNMNTVFSFQNEQGKNYSLNDILSNKDDTLIKIKKIMENTNIIYLGSYRLTLDWINKTLENNLKKIE